jgi:protein-S-isoprenylcysteine O-methyltransferase Ste14
MIEISGFVIISVGIVYISRASLLYPTSHGFHRFFAWECMLILLLLNVRRWFDRPFSIPQIVSWLLLFASLLLVLLGINVLRRKGNASEERRDEPLLAFEKTTILVTNGAYRYIRHPLYSSLLFLNWGIFFKDPSPFGALLALAATMFLILTARAEEREDIGYFGEEYREYMKRTKMFVPYVL